MKKEEVIYNKNNEGRVVKIYLRFNDEKPGEELPVRPIVSFVMGIEIKRDAVAWSGEIHKNIVKQEDVFVMLGSEYEEFLQELKNKKGNKLKIEDHLQDTDSFVSFKIIEDNRVRIKASFREYIGEPEVSNVNIEVEVQDIVLDNLYKVLTKHTQF